MKKLIVAVSLLGILFTGQLRAQTETSGRNEIYRATHTKSTELKHTKLRVNFDYAKEQMNGEAWITASPYFYASDSLILDAKAMLIHEVALEKSGARSPLKYTYSNDILKINLDKSYNRTQDYTVYIKYTARPNEVTQTGSAAITDAKGLYFVNAQGTDPDKPVQIWTQGETEASSAWFPTVDKPNQKTTQEIYMTVPDKYVTLSNGLMKSSVKDGKGMRTDHWVQDKKHAPYLFFMGVGDYAIVKDKWRNIAVDYYVEKEYEPYAKQIFGNTPEMLEFFSTKLKYDYPWSKYAQITARDYVSGAMENTTAVLHQEAAQQKPGDLIDENRWEDVIAHEAFHHWFGNIVTTESWSNLTVNESFANYSEYLWNEHKYGKDYADYTLMKAAQGYYADPANITKDLVRFNYHSKEDMFDGVSYNKGGSILHMLRNYLGDDAFYAGLNDYLKTNEYGTGEASQVRLSLEKVSGKDLNWFFNQWFYGSGHPKLSYTTTYEPVKKQVTVTLSQNQAGDAFEFPLAVDVYENGKPTRRNVWVNAKSRNIFSFPVAKNPDFINLNADGVLLAEITENKTPEQYFMQYSGSKEFLSRYKAVDNAAENSAQAASLETLTAALKDPNFRIRMRALAGLDLSKADHSKAALAEVEKLASNDPKTLVQAAAISALAKTKNKKYLPVFEKGISAVSNSVKAGSLAAIAGIDPSRVGALADKIDLESAGEDLMTELLPLIVKNKIEKQMHAIASTVAFYPFIKFQNPKLGTSAEEGFNWIMTSDNLKATENLTKILMQAKGQIGQNPQAKMMISQMLKDGLQKKMGVLKGNPKSPTINQQVDLINKAIEAYK
ncbi:M1 family metallopeptidase [Kaistella sp. PBT33-4]|uniref:M1 family metallopeptidase n=1 Tax=Kaistella sp. PBT33-4 TaxID=3032000 RepID=UPI0023D876E9|nr:M1 family metallopeptidase [Kaistella sp. PBT33-4]MDF0720441.1 M1 family metallopeptidase [Kaistella sp. PBT33-4]